MNCWMGIDAGTSGIKAIVINESGIVLGKGYEELDVISQKPGYAEQNPLDWWAACCKAVKKAVSVCGCGREIKGIGFSGQMQGAVFLDKNGHPIRNCLLWLDQRAAGQASFLEKYLERSGVDAVQITGNHCMNSFWAPKLLWMKENEPDNYEKIDKILFPKDYLSYRMTGEMAAEVSDASLTYFLDIKKRDWSGEMFQALGISRGLMPKRLLESCDIVGGLLPQVAEDLGLMPAIPVVAGGGDQTANGIGAGIISDGITGASIGTSAVIFGCCKKPFIDKQNHATFSMCHSVAGMWSYLGLSLTAGASLKWARDNFFAEEKKKCLQQKIDIYDYISSIAAKAKPGCEGVTFLPYFNGDSTPNNDPNARACFFGLSLRSGMPELCRSILEGVVYSLRDTVELCRRMGTGGNQIRVTGGGAKSPLWRQIQADIFDAEVVCMNIDEGPGAGAAIMAGVGAGYFKDVAEGCRAILSLGDITVPIRENVKVYDDFYQTYHDLYGHLRAPFARQAELVSGNKL